MAAAPATIEKPLSITVTGSDGQAGEPAHPGTLHVAQLLAGSSPDSQEFVAIMASSLNSPPIAAHEALAIQGLLTIVESGEQPHLSDVMKAGFREANRSIRGEIESGRQPEAEGVAMLALLTRGKYATIGLVGPDRAYLMRANRLTQLTRDQRVTRARSRRKQDIEEQAATAVSPSAAQLLGDADRLDPRFPAVFEITLLPEDRLGLLSRGVLDSCPEDQILAALGASANQGLRMLTAGLGPNGGSPLLAAVLEVAPAREAPVFVPAPAAQSRLWWPVLLLVIALAAIVAGVYFVVM